MFDRRTFLSTSAAVAAGALCRPLALEAAPKVRVTKFEILPMRATQRTVWVFVRLSTDAGLTGLGEASDAFGFANTTKEDSARMESQLRTFFALIEGKSPLEIAPIEHRPNAWRPDAVCRPRRRTARSSRHYGISREKCWTCPHTHYSAES